MNYLKNFNEQGFVIIKNFLSEKEIADIFYDLKSMIDEIITKNINFKDLKDLDKKYLELKKKNPLLKSHFYDLISRLESVQRVFFKPQIIKFINSVLESPVIIDGIQMRIDDPSNDRMLPMHQERGQISHRTLTAWCPLIDITESSWYDLNSTARFSDIDQRAPCRKCAMRDLTALLMHWKHSII